MSTAEPSGNRIAICQLTGDTLRLGLDLLGIDYRCWARHGRNLASGFAERGAHLFVSARDPAAAQATVDLIRQRGRGAAEALTCDLAAPASRS